ncbi:hypothetical protein H6P81_021694 [Aristolochia fimbriata]|uniref:Uncharacterized protein n=1 Tax=Aristolochia fimbriata TaxID=158543 RepID=A0AAV7DQ96_ARIFI|nr:hypothetical protein H6P81_021694 [Aristolochia fimbriata]
MPLDVLATPLTSMYSTKSIALADRPGNLQNFIADGDRSLQLLVYNEEFLNPATIEVFERKLHPRPLGQGYTCSGATPDAASPTPASRCPTAGGRGVAGRADWSSLPGRGWLKTLCPKSTSHDESGGSPLTPPGGSSRGPRPLALKRTPGSASADREALLGLAPQWEADGAGDASRQSADGGGSVRRLGRRPRWSWGLPARRMIPPADTPLSGPRRVARLPDALLAAPVRLLAASGSPFTRLETRTKESDMCAKPAGDQTRGLRKLIMDP